MKSQDRPIPRGQHVLAIRITLCCFITSFLSLCTVWLISASLQPSKQPGLNYLAALAVAAVLSVLSGIWISQRLSNSMTALSASVKTLSGESLNSRISPSACDPEFHTLLDLYNDMLARLDKSFHDARRFTADAAHELNTPVAILIGKLDAAIQNKHLTDETRIFYGELLNQAVEMKTLTETLLLLSRSDNRRLKLNYETVNLTQMVSELAEDVQILAPKLKSELKILTADEVHVSADRTLLKRVLHNLASNAIKYNSRFGEIRMELGTNSTHARFRISNLGQEIPEEDRDRIFERFYRVEQSRSRRTGGTGLGLSLVREIAKAHGGTIELCSHLTPGWNTFDLTFPLAPAHSS